MMSKHHVYVIVPIMWIMGMTSIDIHSDAQVCLLYLFSLIRNIQNLLTIHNENNSIVCILQPAVLETEV